MTERRFFKFSTLRSSGNGKSISGYAAVFNSLSDDLGGFRERILPGAFDRCLKAAPDVRCLFNHDANFVLGRTVAGTLHLKSDTNGLRFDCDLPDTQAGRDVRESIRRGDVDQCSFGFVVQGQNWLESGGETIRELRDVDLFDVSPVTYPAYPQTSVSARVLWPDGEPAEIRTHKKADGPRATKPKPVTVSLSSRTAAPISNAEAHELFEKVNKKLGIPTWRKAPPFSKFDTLEGLDVRNTHLMSGAEQRELRHFLRTGKHEQRDLSTGGAAAAFVPEAFNAEVFQALKAFDAIFSDAVVTMIEADSGGPLDLMLIDDTVSAAAILAEASPSSEQDPGSLKVQLANAPTYDSGMVRVSWATLQDAKVDFPAMLAKAFAVRFGRGIGPSLISTLLAASKLGATAVGSAKNTGGSETGVNSIGTGDLVALRTSVNPGYRAAGAWWLMNDNTLAFLDGLLDKQGRPVFKQVFVGAQRMLMGYPVGICPAMDDIGSGKKPIAFGATGYFAVRTVKGEGELIRLEERYAEFLQTGFKSYMRCNAALLCAAGADSPVKYLQCVSS